MMGRIPDEAHLPRVRAACRVVMSLSDGAVHDETGSQGYVGLEICL